MMKTILPPALILVLLAAGAQAFENPGVVGQVPDRVVITLAPGVAVHLGKSDGGPALGIPALDALAARFDVTRVAPLYGEMARRVKDDALRDELGRVYTVDFPAAKGLQTVLAAYAGAVEVAKAQAVDICKQCDAFLPNDLTDQQYFLRNVTLGGKDIRAVGGWAESLGDSSVIVAITDSGMDWQHPDLGGPHPDHVNGSVWTNWDEYYGTPGVDDDSNGKVDDIRGWDFVDVPGQGWPDEDDATPDNDPMDYEGHGTNCAGCVAPITDNGIGVAATAPGVKVMAIRVGWLPDGETQGVVRMDFAAQGMVYAVTNGAKIVNCSWGSSSFLSSAVATVLAQGGLICTAAGNANDNVASYLGSYPDARVLAVAATDGSDIRASFSSYGTWVELAAPGVAIYTTAYNHTNGTHFYTSTQGTSFSSPITAGAAALVWSAHPQYSASQISSTLRNSADSIDALNPGFEGQLGSGRVNLLRALGDHVQEVPGEFLLLRDAVNEAAVGDTIKVLASHPLSATTLLGKSLKIFGGYAAGYTSRDPLGTPTVITGNLANPALQFTGSITNACEVDGFRIQGGGGRLFSNIPYSGRYGGGIMLNQTSPTLRNLMLTGNSVGGSGELGLGGGIALYNSTAVLENIAVTANTGIYGAGVFVYLGSPTFTSVTIADNAVITDNGTYPARGGGLHAVDTSIVLTDCTVSGHLGTEQGGGIYAGGFGASTSLTMSGGAVVGNSARASGGGIAQVGGDLSLTDVTLADNIRLATSTFMAGGGLYASGATVAATGLTVTGNEANIGGGVHVTASPDCVLTNSVVAGNTAQFWGGAAIIENCPDATVANLTLTANNGGGGGGGLYASGSTLSASNTISAFNTGGAAYGNGFHVVGGTATFACDDAFGNDNAAYGGVTDPTGSDGNIAANPLFCDAGADDYTIADNSPCAPDHSGGCGLIGALDVNCSGGVGVQDDLPGVPVAFRVDPAYPNPFNPQTTIRFALSAAAPTTVVVYDIAGRRVKTLVDAELPAAEHTVRWAGDDGQGRAVAAGVYFYRVRSGVHDEVHRMALVK